MQIVPSVKILHEKAMVAKECARPCKTILASPQGRPVRTLEQAIKQSSRRLLVAELDHVYYSRSCSLVAQFDCHAGFPYTLDAVGENDR